jgi:hypothetical protein
MHDYGYVAACACWEWIMCVGAPRRVELMVLIAFERCPLPILTSGKEPSNVWGACVHVAHARPKRRLRAAVFVLA